MRHTLLFLLCWPAAIASSQWTTGQLPQNTSSDIAMAVADMNGDLLSDILTIAEDGTLLLMEQTVDHHYESRVLGRLGNRLTAFSIVVADFNNDDRKDFAIAGETFVPRLYYQQADRSFVLETIGTATIFAQGMNALDIDQDGWVDLLVCNDVGESVIYKNNAGLLQAWDLIDMATFPTSDNSGNYSAVWLDVDLDQDLDLYIAKCRAGVTDPTDPRRINALYINENGSFREAAATYGIAIGHQSWSVSAGDLDNDGDEDLYLTNHEAPDQILVNRGNRFDIIDLIALPEHFAFQGIITDLNLDGLLDIVVTGRDAEFALINKGNLSFDIDRTIIEDFDSGLSLTAGDLDDDGDIDLYKARGRLGDDVLLLNPASDTSNWVKVTLAANDATVIQSTILTYVDGHATAHVVRAGESYGLHLSKTKSIGLGKRSVLDSIVVRWRGAAQPTTHYSIPAGDHILLYPSGCTGRFLDLAPNRYVICQDETATISGPSGFTTYQWSATHQGQNVELPAGHYQLTATDGAGCTSIGHPITVTTETLTAESIAISGSSICNGQPVVITTPASLDAQWSDGSTSNQRTFDQAADLQLLLTNRCQDTLQQSIQIEALTAPSPPSEDRQISSPDVVRYTAQDPIIIRDETGRILFRGTDFVSDIIESDTTITFATHVIGPTRSVDSIGIPAPSDQYASDQINSGILFEVTEPIVLSSVDVSTDQSGVRRLALLQDGQTIWQENYDLNIGINRLQINRYLEEGTYILRTVTGVNQANFGHPGPRFTRSTTADFPYRGDGLTLTATLNGTDNYYYFYNWIYDTHLALCESDPAELRVALVSNTSEETSSQLATLYPNPTRRYLQVAGHADIEQVTIIDVLGRKQDVRWHQNRISVSHLPPGTYHLLLQSGQKISTHLFVKQ